MTPLHARALGRGPDVLLVHGFPIDGSMWEPAAEILARSCRLLIPDLRGFGRSPGTPDAAMADYADDLASLLDARAIDRPALVAGLSFGGYVVMEFLRRHPARLGALGLIDTREVPDPPEAARGRRASAERVEAGEPVSVVVDPMLPKMAAPDAPPEFIALWRGVMCAQSPVGVAAALRAMADRPDSSQTLRGFGGRTLLVVGEHDAITPVDVHERMASLLPDPHLRVVPGVGHMAPTEAPGEFARIVEEFLGV